MVRKTHIYHNYKAHTEAAELQDAIISKILGSIGVSTHPAKVFQRDKFEEIVNGGVDPSSSL